MNKFLAKQTTKLIGIVLALLTIVSVGIFCPSALATINTTNPNSTIVTGKDIVGSTQPLIVSGTATSQENTWGRLIRITGANSRNVAPFNGPSFFDIGIDDEGNFFINAPVDTKTSHSLIISPDGFVTIPRKK
ncbi:hypothetical protein [Anabaena azotica]|uniref:SxtE n=1 Tax=Anabaena azotica FACHB-119 TaxID=947527 RepID=A0ABR8D283_9NOST|nr:hypothetical protein [Anabaena azotica]MBD2501258.1 hypothetical protein [Anabaena azotica FACHB-119]